MKKTLFSVAIVAAILATACQKNNGSNKEMDADLVMSTPFETMTFGQPYEFNASVVTSSTVEKAEIVAMKKASSDGQEKMEVAGTPQPLDIEGEIVKGTFFVDYVDASGFNVTLSAGDKSKSFFFPVNKIAAGNSKMDYYANDALCLCADSLVQNHINSPELFPDEFTGKGSAVPSFFSMHGVKINGEVKHVLTLTEARELDGKALSFCWVNVLQNTANRVFIGSQRGYMLSGCKASSLGGGTTGRQCDTYMVDGHQIKDANIDNFGMTVVTGQWSSSYKEELFKAVDALFTKIPESCETTLDRVKGVWYLSQIQKNLDNSTLGETENPTTLPNKTYLRRYADAGDNTTSPLVENFRAGDYVIIRSKVMEGETPAYYYGILQFVQLYDDSKCMATNESGKVYIDRKKAQDLFLQPNYFSVKAQCFPR